MPLQHILFESHFRQPPKVLNPVKPGTVGDIEGKANSFLCAEFFDCFGRVNGRVVQQKCEGSQRLRMELFHEVEEVDRL